MNIRVKTVLDGEARRFAITPTSTYAQFQQLIQELYGKQTASLKISYVDDEGDNVSVSTEFEWTHALQNLRQGDVLRVTLTENKKPETSSCSEEKEECKFKRFKGRQYKFRECKRKFNAQKQEQSTASSASASTASSSSEQPSSSSSTTAPDFSNFGKVVQDYATQMFEQIKQAPQVHFHITCDRCNKRGFTGVRHKCQQCPDFDLCGDCIAHKNECHDPSHTFAVVEAPQQRFQHWVQNMVNQFSQQAATAPQETAPAPQEPVPQPEAEKPVVVEQQQPASESIPVQPQPVSAPVPPPRFEAELQSLAAMGFTDSAKNLQLLDQFKGNMTKVIDALL